MILSLLPWAADALILLGIAIMSIGIYGMIWMPDLYTSLHAASKSAFLGIIPIILAVSLLSDPAFAMRSLLIGIFLLLTTPVAAHAIARAAYLKGEPMETPGAVDESGRQLPTAKAGGLVPGATAKPPPRQ